MKCKFCSNPAEYESLGICKDPACFVAWEAPRKAANAAAGLDPRVIAIRADKAVGEGTCSSIDECYENTQLLETLNERGMLTPELAVRWAREVDGLHWESGLNQMSGEPETDGPIREMYEESVARNKLPIEV